MSDMLAVAFGIVFTMLSIAWMTVLPTLGILWLFGVLS